VGELVNDRIKTPIVRLVKWCYQHEGSMRKVRAQAEPAKKVIAYTRVSTMGQVEDGESLERQAARIKAYCEAKGLPEPEIVSDEGQSGFKSSREGFQKLVALCESRQVKTVIVYDLSRLSRSVRDTLEFIEDTINKNGIEFVSLLNDIDTSTPTGKAFLGITAIFNQLYRDEIAYKTKEALSHKRAKQEKTGGTIPFGFELVGGVKLAPLPGEFETLKLMHTLRGEGHSLREIAAILTSKGVATKTGRGEWQHRVVKDILDRTANLICQDESLSEEGKDTLLHEVTGALYQVKWEPSHQASQTGGK
jgi:site-specific DNA recombinase